MKWMSDRPEIKSHGIVSHVDTVYQISKGCNKQLLRKLHRPPEIHHSIYNLGLELCNPANNWQQHNVSAELCRMECYVRSFTFALLDNNSNVTLMQSSIVFLFGYVRFNDNYFKLFPAINCSRRVSSVTV
jgi:hypothetical protein